MKNYNYQPNDFYLRNNINNNNPYSIPSKNSKTNIYQNKRRENENVLIISSKK